MTKKEKIDSLNLAMMVGLRDNGEKFNHFSEGAPEELKDLFLKHYEVQDLDYETFNAAIDMLIDIYSDIPLDNQNIDYVDDSIYERASDCASVYTSDRLAYLNLWNQDEISEIVHSISSYDIATACAIWYDKRIEEMAIIINQWINS